MNNASEQQFQKYNLGISILRAWMCFEVILGHFWENRLTKFPLLIFQNFVWETVTVFMIMSFFLTGKMLMSNDKTKIKRRIERLILPQIFWTIAYFVIYKLLDIGLNTNFEVSIKDFFFQLFLGHSSHLNASMWYQIDLLLITIMFILVFKVFTTNTAIWILKAIGLFSIIMQYTGLNFLIFNKCIYEIKFPLGRLCEITPAAIVGFLLGYYRIVELLEKRKGLIIVEFLLILGMLYKFDIFTSVEGFGYQGLDILVKSIVLFIIFDLFPFEKLPSIIRKSIHRLTKYTLGIYCMHRMVGSLLNIFFMDKFNLEKNTFTECLLIYALCYIVSMLIERTRIDWCQKAVN